MKKILFLLLAFPGLALAADYVDDRMGTEVVRDEDGRIKRSSYLVYKFKQLYACPSTGLHYGACPGWSVDHVVPLVCGGRDIIENLQWLPNAIKSAAGELPKDRWEQDVYCSK